MTATKKQSGYLVKIEAFVPADLSEMAILKIVQENTDHAVKTFGPAASVTHTVATTRR